MSELLAAARKIARAKIVLFDWDGCLANGGALLPGALDLLQAIGPRAFVLSNNSTDQPISLQAFLASAGVRFDTERILLAGYETLRRQAIAARERTVHLVASPAMTAFAASLGLRCVGGAPEAVVILRDLDFTFDKLEAAANAARRCRRIVLANPDLTHPGIGGAVVPETGSLFAAISACLGGVEVKLDVVGKPGPILFHEALKRAGVEPCDAVMLGDNPDTDGSGALAAGIPFVLIQPAGAVNLASLAPAVANLDLVVPPLRMNR